MHNATNATNPDSIEAGYDGRIREIVMDNADRRTTVRLLLSILIFSAYFEEVFHAYIA